MLVTDGRLEEQGRPLVERRGVARLPLQLEDDREVVECTASTGESSPSRDSLIVITRRRSASASVSSPRAWRIAARLFKATATSG